MHKFDQNCFPSNDLNYWKSSDRLWCLQNADTHKRNILVYSILTVRFSNGKSTIDPPKVNAI